MRLAHAALAALALSLPLHAQEPARDAALDDGPLPLTVLEARIDEWIGKQL